MKFRFNIVALIFILFGITSVYAQTNGIGIGEWRDHLSYYYTHNVCKVGDKILVASQSSLFYYDVKTKRMDKFTRVNGLSDAGIGVTAYDEESKTIVITYENSNIDIVRDGNIYNIPDIKNRSIEGSKSINSIFFSDKKAYLSCGFGVVVLDLERHEIYDTWYLGENSSAIRVNTVYIDDTVVFAGTVNGLLYADKNSRTLAASQTWKKKDIIHESGKEINFIVPLNREKLLLNVIDSATASSVLVGFNGEITDTFLTDLSTKALKNYNGKIGLVGYLAFDVYDTNMNQIYHISDMWNPVPGVVFDVRDFVMDDTDVWFAHSYSGLLYIKNYKESNTGNREIIYPNGPMTNDAYSMTVTSKGKLYVAPGGKDVTDANKFIRGDVYIYDGYWDRISRGLFKDDTIYDILKVTIDPDDEKHAFMSSWWNGIMEMYNDSLTGVYTEDNTEGKLLYGGYNYRIAGIDYDASGNLLIANSGVPYGFVYRNYNGVWGNFLTNQFLVSDEIEGMTLDRNNYYKLIYTKTNKILLINDNGDMAWIDPNRGSSLQTNQINCITQDKDGEMWIGTEKGIKVIYSLYGALDNASSFTDVECNNIIYDENGIVQYLLSFENVTCIMIDGANRKWVGTERNGVYVLSPSGDKEIKHFTLENSPLFSNKIICMSQNPVTGEVFIGTDRGIISYKAQSVEPIGKKEYITVLPNPVRPEYDGYIAMKGFADDSDVKVTDANGVLVAHLKSQGGQAVWDGRNFNGQKSVVACILFFLRHRKVV